MCVNGLDVFTSFPNEWADRLLGETGLECARQRRHDLFTHHDSSLFDQHWGHGSLQRRGLAGRRLPSVVVHHFLRLPHRQTRAERASSARAMEPGQVGDDSQHHFRHLSGRGLVLFLLPAGQPSERGADELERVDLLLGGDFRHRILFLQRQEGVRGTGHVGEELMRAGNRNTAPKSTAGRMSDFSSCLWLMQTKVQWVKVYVQEGYNPVDNSSFGQRC